MYPICFCLFGDFTWFSTGIEMVSKWARLSLHDRIVWRLHPPWPAFLTVDDDLWDLGRDVLYVLEFVGCWNPCNNDDNGRTSRIIWRLKTTKIIKDPKWAVAFLDAHHGHDKCSVQDGPEEDCWEKNGGCNSCNFGALVFWRVLMRISMGY